MKEFLNVNPRALESPILEPVLEIIGSALHEQGLDAKRKNKIVKLQYERGTLHCKACVKWN